MFKYTKILLTFLLGSVSGIISGDYIYNVIKPEGNIRMTHPIYVISTDPLKSDILMYGDTAAYIQLKGEFSQKRPYDIFYYALIMANKYNYHKACYDVYKSLVSIYALNPALGEMDSVSISIANEYLRRGAQKGDQRAIRELKKYKDI